MVESSTFKGKEMVDCLKDTQTTLKFKDLPPKPTKIMDIEKEAVLEWQRMSQTLIFNKVGDDEI